MPVSRGIQKTAFYGLSFRFELQNAYILELFSVFCVLFVFLSAAYFPGSHLDGFCFESDGLSVAKVTCSSPFPAEAGFQPPLIANPFSSPFPDLL